jgi:hypothetical protein
MGLVDVKGKGDVETWRLVSRNGHLGRGVAALNVP